ncbi:hypothetical protein [Tardiphaga sp. 839_C3_N1_4]|uniref:hypothetical protein n=1 Tax=Tardiphaga sp. 839_C3_N1_4 TaxID=3240761 RepID=UPI003F1EF919
MKTRLMALAIAGVITLWYAQLAQAAQGSGCLPTTGTVSGLTMTQKMNDAIAALTSFFSGASPPSTDCSAAPVKGQAWLDTSVTPNVEKRYDGTNWVVVGSIDSVNHVWSPPVGGGTSSITANTTTDICASPSALQTITGTTPITSFGSACAVGVRKTLIFNSATPITYNATSMILPALRDYTASAGDAAEAVYLGSGNWRVLTVNRIDGGAVTNPAVPLGTVLHGDFATIPAKTVVGQGQAIARASFPDYFAAMTRSQTGTLTSGNNTITSVPNTAGLGAGMPIEGVGIPSGTTIASVTSSTIVMSSPNTATVTGSQTVRTIIPGYGIGGDSTTIGVKNCQGVAIVGRDSGASRLPGASVYNTLLGSATTTLNTINLPPYTPSGLVSTGFSSPQQFYGGTQASNIQQGAASFVPFAAVSATTLDPNNWGLNSSFSGSAQGGTSTPFTNVQPTSVAECVVAVLP